VAVEPPADPLVVHTVSINASMPRRWGRPAAFDQQPERQPTGLYVAPGALATVSVPAGELLHHSPPDILRCFCSGALLDCTPFVPQEADWRTVVCHRLLGVWHPRKGGGN
jgi:hypothetical protein